MSIYLHSDEAVTESYAIEITQEDKEADIQNLLLNSYMQAKKAKIVTLPKSAVPDVVGVACVRCHASKVKCSNEKPCNVCLKAGVECVARDPHKRGRKVRSIENQVENQTRKSPPKRKREKSKSKVVKKTPITTEKSSENESSAGNVEIKKKKVVKKKARIAPLSPPSYEEEGGLARLSAAAFGFM